jgi:hypothetical protein
MAVGDRTHDLIETGVVGTAAEVSAAVAPNSALNAGPQRSRGLLVTGAIASALLLVCSLAAFVLQEGDSLGATELAGRYNYGLYNGLAPDRIHDRTVRNNPNSLVYYNVFTGKAVKPHRWLVQDNYKGVFRKALDIISRVQRQEDEQSEKNDKFRGESAELGKKLENLRTEATAARQTIEREFRKKIVEGVAQAESEGYEKLDGQKAAIKSLLNSNLDKLKQLLEDGQDYTDTQLQNLRDLVQKHEDYVNQTLKDERGRVGQAEKDLTDADQEQARKLKTLQDRVNAESKQLSADADQLTKDLLKAKLALADEVDSDVAKMRNRLHIMILEVRVIIVRFMRQSQQNTRSRMGSIGANLNSKYKQIKEALQTAASKEAAFAQTLGVAQDNAKLEANRLSKSLESNGRLGVLTAQLQAMGDQMTKTIERLRSEQKAGALFLERAADQALGGVKEQLESEQKGDEEAMLRAHRLLAAAEQAMAAAAQGSFWKDRDAGMAELRTGLQAMTDALNALNKLRSKSQDDTNSLLRSAEQDFTHGYVAQYWWIFSGDKASAPQMYSPPDRQVLLGEVSMAGALAGNGRQESGKKGMLTGDGVGAAARFFGVFDVPVTGEYTIYVKSSGTANLWIDSQLTTTVAQVAGAEPKTKESVGKLRLDGGLHTLWLEHVSVQGPGELSVEWESNKGMSRQALTGWHSGAEPGWQLQLFFFDTQLPEMPKLRGVQSDREGVVNVIDYASWNDWNTAMQQQAMLPASANTVNKMKLAAIQTSMVSTDCSSVARSALETLQGTGATCDNGVLASVNLATKDCAEATSARTNFTCLNVPRGSCVERVGECQSIEQGNPLWEAKCGNDEALTAVRVHRIGCGEGQRRLAWRCCKVGAPTLTDKARLMPDNGDYCHAAGDVSTTCAEGMALESWSVSAKQCANGGFRITSVCAEVPQAQMPIGRVAATFWGFLRTASDQTVQIGLESAGGSRLQVDGRLAIDNDGLHAQREVRGNVALTRGNHLIAAQWFQDTGPELLRVYTVSSSNDQFPLKVWHFPPPRVPDSVKQGHFGGGILSFSGKKDSFVQQAGFLRMPSDSFTIALWVMAALDKKGSNGVLFSYRNQGSTLSLELRTADSLTFEVMGSVVDTGVSIVDGIWHHVAVTWRSRDGKVMLYMDGSPVITSLGNAQDKAIPNGGCLVVGQHVEESGCSNIDNTDAVTITYDDEGSFRGAVTDVVIGNTAWTGDRVRAAMNERDWTSADSVAGTVWAITRRQPSPKQYADGSARALCALDVSPLSNWRTSCAGTWNVQWRAPAVLQAEQSSRGGTPKVMQLSGYGRAAAVRNRFTKMPSKAFTVCMWIKASDGGRDGIMLSYGETAAPQPLVEVLKPSDLQASVLGSSVQSMLSILDDTWHHVAVTWESETGEVRIYVEGKELVRQLDVGKGLQIPNGGCLALGERFTAVCTLDASLVDSLAAAKQPQSESSSGLVAQLTDILIYNRVIPLGYLRACMHSEAADHIGLQWLRLAITGEQYPDVAWLPQRPQEITKMSIQTCAKNGGLRGMFMSEGTYKSLSECRYRCPLLVGDYVAVRTIDRAKTLEVHVRMVGVTGAQLSFPDAIGIRYLSDTVTLAGDAKGPQSAYYMMNGARITSFPAISRAGMRVLCVQGTMPGCTRNSARATLLHVYSPDGSLVSFWTLGGLWGGYEVQLPINCYAEAVEGLAGSLSSQAHDFAVGGTKTKFGDLDEKCAASGPLAKQLDGLFDGTDAGSSVAKWCESWSVANAAATPIMQDLAGKASILPPFKDVPKPVDAGAAPTAQETALGVPTQQTCDVLADRAVWFEACKYAEVQWGAAVGIPALLLAKGYTQEMRSVKPDPRILKDSSGNGQDMEGRGVELAGDAQGLIQAKRDDPLDLRQYKTFPEKLSVWAFDAAGDETCAARGTCACHWHSDTVLAF